MTEGNWNMDEMTQLLGHPRTLLDVGTGGGHLQQIARDRGARVEVFAADIESDESTKSLTEAKFDLLLFDHVLEQTKNPRAALERFLPYLEEGGRVLLSLGDSLDRAAAIELVKSAGLEILYARLYPVLSSSGLAHISKRVAEVFPRKLKGRTVIVARRRPTWKKLTLTVGMISMNEAGAVGRVIQEIRAHVPQAEILLVDSSKDETPQIAEANGARVLRQFPPKGYGPAMMRLLREATTEVIVTMDCDGTYPADRIVQLLALIEEGADLVNATRTRSRPKAMPLPNYVANRVFAGAAHLMHGLKTTDVHSGMRAYRTSMLRGIEIDPKGAALPVELMVVPARLGYRLVEVEIPYFERIGETSLRRFESTKWTFQRLFRASNVGARTRKDRATVI